MSNEDFLIAIVSCPKNADRVRRQEETWIPKMIERGFPVEVMDGTTLGVSDDYLSLPLKTKTLCRWAVLHGYKHMLKIDDDGYIYAERFEPVQDDYVGMWIPKNDMGHPTDKSCPPLPPGTCKFDYASGGAYWLSERSMRIVAAAEINDWAEDRWVGQTLGAAGILFKAHPDYLVQGYPFYKSASPHLTTQVKDWSKV